ncbi:MULTISPECIES: SDR family oxidoreductase [Marivita]|jgi:3-oxoacyl-[acyl-carrier protein] reductase|uniref:SDR family oxidoreductase n=1 Tax=Marivita cryptomonadis TaxID=505252 RepID=A0A9Q2PCW6_9RHOB|nr:MULTISPECIES: SDR family oxidoreductase [Marivita]MBM2323200.1 SDR family oxidoreductase [Marivita cryptomonadis]MBM2332784.1 SDR family oxidoreductase [Marivita cryptomonadis]MBM2342366.1 SDR family oxidoreductase [Marivita cryptomonadis]MBM2347033.1 SDR family oxidoreductase [Marivita cryptomonadis]MBM2351710.1 SDR family oxidoreductase [Marivita cryptomonadis]
MRLQGKTSIITGAASGFGREMARRFVKEGAKVAIVDLNEEGANAVAAELGENAIAVKCDVSSASDVQATVETVKDAFGQIDIVINNAGWSHKNQPLMDVDYETFRRVYAINVDSIYHMTHAMVPHWRKIGGGVMINVGSTAGIRPRPGLSWYNSSKGAVNMMTKTLAVELATDKVRVCGLAPVMGATALLETFMGMPDTPENRAKFLSTIPLGRLCEPEDMANAALYLASDEANFITGVILEVDGGRTI